MYWFAISLLYFRNNLKFPVSMGVRYHEGNGLGEYAYDIAALAGGKPDKVSPLSVTTKASF